MENPEIKKEWFKKDYVKRFRLFCKPCNVDINIKNKLLKWE